MRILATGDIHGDKIFARELAERAEKENVDLVLLCGDLTHMDEDSDGIIGPFLEKNKKVAFLTGNHDSWATGRFLSEKYQVDHLHGQGKIFGDVGIIGCGGANIGVEKISEDEIEGYLRKAAGYVEGVHKKLMVTHVHPSGTQMEKMTKFFPGSTGLRRAVEYIKPQILLCCHVHEASGLEEKIGDTTVINVSRQAKVFDI